MHAVDEGELRDVLRGAEAEVEVIDLVSNSEATQSDNETATQLRLPVGIQQTAFAGRIAASRAAGVSTVITTPPARPAVPRAPFPQFHPPPPWDIRPPLSRCHPPHRRSTDHWE